MGMRGRDELLYGDLEIKNTTDGTKFVEFSERDTMTHNGESSNSRPFRPKMWSTPENLDHCPVRIFELYVSKRPSQMCEPQSPFYLSVNRNPCDIYWYKKQRMGTNTLGQIMPSLAKKANLEGKK